MLHFEYNMGLWGMLIMAFCVIYILHKVPTFMEFWFYSVFFYSVTLLAAVTWVPEVGEAQYDASYKQAYT